MLTNLNWLSKGAIYPPAAEKERLDAYRTNELLFLSKHNTAWEDEFDEMRRRLRKKGYDIDTIINYQQLLSKKTADFVCGEPPTIETEQETDILDKLLENQNWGVRLYEAIIDVSRYGNAVLKLVGNRLTAVSPAYWFPIVESTDLKTITQHVIAYPISQTELYAEIHDIGRIEQRVYGYEADKHEIGTLKSTVVAQTGLNDFAVQVLTNVTHSGSIYGLDDYAIINSLVRRIMWRLRCIGNVLDKHSEPSVSGPSSALEYDERTGLHFLNLGNYFKRNDAADPDVKYITWDGNLESAFKEIDALLTQLYILSEMGQAFMEGGGGGEASSGTALKLRMVAPRIKAARLVGINNGKIKQIIYLLAQLNGITIDYDGLSLRWNDGLPLDEVEQTNTLLAATGGKAIMSQYAALKARGLSDTETEAELEQMAEEAASAAPLMLTTLTGRESEGGDE